MKTLNHDAALNGICPYFTMFPLEFPLGILKRNAKEGSIILDPFCGRGTTNYAARLLGLSSVGVDSSPVAAAIARAKMVNTTPEDIIAEAAAILEETEDYEVPAGEFWSLAYHPDVLEALCRLRSSLMRNCRSGARKALRVIILGALHGPKQKTFPSYFSNQCTRTYAPKPKYAVNFWTSRCMEPEAVDVLEIIRRRANKYYASLPIGDGVIRLADSRTPGALKPSADKYSWVITSPPYYGMRTYIPDQWLRNWFMGGLDHVDYSNASQVIHSSPQNYVKDLQTVWKNSAAACKKGAHLVIRFGGIPDRNANPKQLIKESLLESGWSLKTVRNAGTARKGRRQADSFLKGRSCPTDEYDIWAVRI